MSKNVLITGGAGFIAHHVIDKMLKETDWKIICLDRLDISGNLNRLHDMLQDHNPKVVSSRLRIVFHDLKAELNEMIIKDIGPVDIILHLAAGSHVDRSIEFPMEFVQDNTVGTVNMLDYARKHLPNLERFVYFSTDEIFGVAPPGVSYKEYDRYNSTNPYSASKAAAEEFCVAYENTFKMPIYCTHTMNVFGERQSPEKFIGLIIQRLLANESVIIHGDEETGTVSGLRHWIHAADVADATMFIMNLPHKGFPLPEDFGGALCPKFNIAGPQEFSNLEVAQKVADIMGVELKYQMVSFDKQRPGHDFRYSLSGEYMKELGWTPKYDFDLRLKQVVDWSLKNEQWLKI